MDEVILVKDDGILPGADGFPLNSNPRMRHPFGRPRMRGRSITVDPPQNIQGLENIPKAPKVWSFTEVDTGLNARRDNRRDPCPVPEFDMKKQYENFMQEMSGKGYELECNQERFNELSTNPQTGSPDEKSLIEAKGALQGEAQGMYTNTRRPSNKAVDLDFEIDSSKGYTHVDFKTPIDFPDLADNKGIDVSNFPSLETVAYNMGKKIPPQKIESPETERINGSYRYETPAYHYKKPDEDLIVTVNATTNKYISVRNATDFQLEKLEIDGNLGYDSRPPMSLTLRLRGPKQ